MPTVLTLAGLILALSISSARLESAELRFLGQTDFVVNETTVVRLVVERIGDPVNVTTLVLLEGDDTGDFEASTAAAFLLSSEASKTIFIAVRDDELPEADETFVFNLRLQSSSNGVRLGTPNRATITILSNDNAFGIISFNSIVVDEPRGRSQYVPLSLVREKGTYGTVTVNFEISGGPNSALEDLSPDQGNITIPPGRAMVVFSILIQDDQIPEDDEVFTVKLTGVAGGALLNPNGSSVELKIRRNDSPLRFSLSLVAVAENAGVISLTVTRGSLADHSRLVGSDDTEVSVDYVVVSGEGAGSATPAVDFVDLQTVHRVTFPPRVYEVPLLFRVNDDKVPEIAESFQVVLLEDTVRGDAVLIPPKAILVTIEPNDKPHGVLSISSSPLTQPISINEDVTDRFDGISIVRNGGNHGDVSVNWTISRNSSDRSPVSDDLSPERGMLRFRAGQMSTALLLNITADKLPEEAEAFVLRLLPDTVQGGAEVDEPMEMVFYIQDSDDVYGLFLFHPEKTQTIQSRPDSRFLSLSFLREGGTLGEVALSLTALYIPAGPVDPGLARDRVLNASRSTTVLFSQGQDQARLTLPIRNDAFLQNRAHFLIQLDRVDLVSISTPIPSVSPRFGGALNLTLTVTPDIANGEIGFTSNTTVVVYEPEDTNTSTVTLSLRRDGTDGQAVVFWSLRPIGDKQADVTPDDLKPLSGSVVFLTGQSDAVINVTIMADNIPEVNETLLLTLDRTNVENQILKPGFTRREIVIVENDDPGGVFEFSSFSRGPWYINEGEAVELSVIRTKGQLLKQLVQYALIPSGYTEFYGATGVLEFKPGEREVLVALVARPDEVPELDETFSMVLSSYSTPASRLGNHREVNITVRRNDDPFGVIEFIRSGLAEAINESKGSQSHSVAYPVVRNRGLFGKVSVSWFLEPHMSADVSPVQGYIVFAEGEYMKNLTLFSVPDEAMENFTITLLSATGGARLGNILDASLHINKNDNPIYFAEPVVVRLQEGGVANLTVLRAGPADFVATVMYRVDYGEASPRDLAPLSNNTVLVFGVGQWMKNIYVVVEEDDIPETEEPFYIILYNTTGDAVVYGGDTATVVIEANDEANGIFSLESTERPVKEGKTNNFYVIRARGHFGNVTVFWRLYANDTALEPGHEFINTSGSITFTTGEETKPIVLQAISDQLPEFNEFYVLRLINISGGYPGEGGRLATTSLNASVLIPFNDDPFGVFAIADDNLDQEVAEDVLSELDMSDVTSFNILRQQGTFGDVRVAWEIVSDRFPIGLPPMQDLLLSAFFPKEVELRPHSRRHHSGTDAWLFSGRQGAYGTISPEDGPGNLANFTFSVWLIPRLDTNGFIVSKGNSNRTLYYGVKVQTNESHVSVMLYYTALGANYTQVARTTAERFVEDNVWLHVVITAGDGMIEFFLDGYLMPGGVKSLKGEAITDAPVRIGSDPYGEERYTGLLQDLRLYHSRLNRSEIHELHAQPAKTDLRNISGYLQYRQDERQKAFVVKVRDDKEEEGEEVFYLQLVAAHGGARLPLPRPTATLRVMKSDNANGFFGFTGTCIPDTTEEGSTISCVIERTRGVLDHVYVNYTVTQLHSDSQAPAHQDFTKASGSVLFLPGQRSEVLNLLVLNDDTPEFAESFQVTLVSAESGDGKPGSTPTSGSSINPDNSATRVTVMASDHPYGLLQFQPSLPAEGIIPPATEPAHVTVNEDDGEVRLLVARAQGLLGRVMVGYRTSPFTAASPEDYEDSDGMLDFLPGERFKYISVIVIDNPVPELDKVFRVELYNPDGGVGQFLGSGSGESDTDFFHLTSHHRASLGVASHITVTIAASDDAHGVFQFSLDSLSVNGTEPEEGRSTVLLQVMRLFGALSKVTVFWEADVSSEEDLISRAGNITFQVGQTRGEIELQVAQDEVPELDKRFGVSLVNVSHGRLGLRTEATVTVLASDDPYGVFVFSDSSRPVRLPEGHTLVTLTIYRQRGLMGRVRVTYGTLSEADAAPFMTPGVGRANEGKDFVPLLESVGFAANQSEAKVTLRVLDDDEPERDESVFMELISVNLIGGGQHERLIVHSPRLGPKAEIVAQVIVEASDDAFGFLQLSAPAINVAEDYVGPIINVTRIGGIFADVSVKFRAVPMTARVGDDYSIASSDVVLLEGETSKPVPIYIIDDVIPELEETFRIELLNVTTGGAKLGVLTRTIITILPSDDPFGAFVFQAGPVTIEEPGVNSFQVTLPIVRNAGAIGTVVVQWRAMVNGRAAVGDLRPVSGEVTFAPGETMKTLKVEVLADDVPEIEEIIKVELTSASNGGNIGRDKTVSIIVPANDNPYGTVYFDQSVYQVQEPLQGIFVANITVRRSGGHFGRVEVLYSTSEIDIVSMAQTEGQNLLLYYSPPVSGVPSGAPRRPVNISSQGDPLVVCATACLRERACQAFSLSPPGGSSPMASCSWVTSGADQLTESAQTLTYTKNTTATAALFSSQAMAGSDYTTTAQTAILEDGSGEANLTVPILTDKLPEMDESFSIRILKVVLVNLTVAQKNLPSIGHPDKAVVTIGMNGDAFGVFLIYSLSSNATQDGLYLEVREEPRGPVPLVIERRGGSLGQVTVEWRFVGGMATPGTDFTGTGGTLVFADGDIKKNIEIVIVDDLEPEDSETLMVGLVKTAGGSRILPSSDTVTIIILANDNVAGVVGFHSASRSVIARKGERLPLLVIRTAPGLGNVTVDWAIQGPRVARTFTPTSGLLFFTGGTLNTTIVLQLLEDSKPEEKELYRVILSNVRTYGVLVTGHGALDDQGREAEVTVETSDGPFGMLSIAPSSLRLNTEERDGTLNVFINREFGASGVVNISYETVRGSLQDLSQVEGGGALAEPGQDFLSVSGSVILQDGQISVAIPVTILDVRPPPGLDPYSHLHVHFSNLLRQTFLSRETYNECIQPQVADTSDVWLCVFPCSFEVNETMGMLNLVVYRSSGTYGNVSLFFYTQNLEGQLGLDYNATPSMLHFADGERHQFVEVQIIDDVIPEGAERFQLILANPSSGLKLGANTTATVNILASDDGHGVISFNSSQPFLLREPTSLSGLGESVATLYVVRDPPQGTFGTVTVQFTITHANGTLAHDDLIPWQGFVVLEDGVKFKTLEIWAVLDAEPEVNETFTVTLSSPTGGARLGDIFYTVITVLQNSAPLGLFRIASSLNRTDSSVVGKEGGRTVFLTVSRIKGLEAAVSVEWETQSDTAVAVEGTLPVMAVYQIFPETPTSGWCSLAGGASPLAMRLDRPSNGGSTQTHATLYRWQGVLVPIQLVANLSCFYQVFVWTGSVLALHQSLELQGVLSVSPFSHGTTLYLVVCVRRKMGDGCVLFQWSGGHFQNPRPLPVSSRAQQVESLNKGADTLLLVITEGSSSSCEVFVWGSQQLFPQHSQSILHPGLASAQPFTLPSGITHLLLAGSNGSALYTWRSDITLFALVLTSPPASNFLSLPLPYINTTKSLLAATEPSGTTMYELNSVSNRSDFIPSYGELRFVPGDQELEIAVNVVNDDVPEEDEQFRVVLKNPKGGAEIGFGGQVTVLIPANDDAHGVIGFTQGSLSVEVEELTKGNPVSLSVERRRGTFRRLTIHWAANGSLEDIFPTSGVVTFSQGQVVATINLTVLADSIPELKERVTITLLDVTTVGLDQHSSGALIDPQRAQALLTILPNGSPYGLIGWHLDSQYLLTQEPQSKNPTNVTLTIVREQEASGEVAVHYQTGPALSKPPSNQASAPQDYTPREGTVIMKENATLALITITILPDEAPELAESFLVNITGVELVGGLTGAAQPSVKRPGMEVAEVTIQENDDPRGVLQFNVSQSGGLLAYEVAPPRNVLHLAVVRLAGRTGRVVVYWEARPITTSLNDFTPSSGNITFQDGQGQAIIDISIVDDTEVESVEHFSVTLMRVIGGARLGVEISVTVTIPPNDSPLGSFGFQEKTVSHNSLSPNNDPAAMATLTVVRSAEGEGAVTLMWRLEDTARDDLSPLNGTLVFNETESWRTLVIRALADAVLEGEENFTVQLLAAKSGAVIDPINGLATITILGDRAALGIVGIAEASRSILIGEPQGDYNGTALVSLVRGPGIFGEIQVYWNITPAVASEFEELSGVVTMRDRQSAVLDDDTAEERRVYQLTLTSVTPGAGISPLAQRATVTMAASDLPHGLFSFVQGLIRASEEEGKVNVTVVRSMGRFGSVWVTYQTAGSVAVSGVDFTSASGRLLFGPGQTTRGVTLSIHDDDLPEGPEEFYLNITTVELLNDRYNVDFSVREHGLQRDQPPAIGNVSSVMIVIQKSDNSEGVLEFLPDYVNITVEEDVGSASIPVVRRVGYYGLVTAEYTSRGLTARAGLDYILGNGSLTFLHGHNTSHINVSIIDDQDREDAETFEIQLSGATGGAILGTHLIARVTIAKSDSPNGVVRFLNASVITLVNPNSTLKFSLHLERAGGFVGNITWIILGPNTKEVLPPVNTDIGDPVNGSFHFRDGEGGLRTIDLRILPHAEVEVAETFVVVLQLLSGDMDIDPRAGSVTLKIEKFGDPNGIVELTEEDLRERVYSEPTSGEGPLNISLLITRRHGVMGNVTVHWQILSDSDTTGDFSALNGSVVILDGQGGAEVVLTLLPDAVPELEELYLLRLSSVEGGATLNTNRSTTLFRVRANDEPHGVFGLAAERQAVVVVGRGAGLVRLLALNVTRQAGAFGNASVGYRISTGPGLNGQELLGGAAVGRVLIKHGEDSASDSVPISTQVFLSVGVNFTLELTDVRLLGPLFSSPPRLLLEARVAIVTVPEEAARCLSEGRSQAVSLQALSNVSEPAAFALHLTAAGSSSPAPGVARLRSGFTVAEVEPLGLYQFAPDSRQLVIKEDVQTITLYVQRLYGFRSNRTRLSYQTVSGSALAGQDFAGVRDGELFFDSPRQTSALLRLSVLDDALLEPDETFFVNLTDVQVLSGGGDPQSGEPRPHLIPQHSVATVTILASDVTVGVLSIGPGLVETTEDREEGSQQEKRVLLRVHRSSSLAGPVRVKVQAYGGGSVGSPSLPFAPEPNKTLALVGQDFKLESALVSLQEGQSEAEVSLIILDDSEPEGQEVFFIYLSDPEGGAQIADGPDQQGFSSFAKIIILGSDFHNGIVGFSVSSLLGQGLDEDSEVNRTALLYLQRQQNRAFEDVEVKWRATFSREGPSLVNNGVNLTRELWQTSGKVLCRRGQVLCVFSMEVRQDQAWFLVEIYQVGVGAAINESSRFANITLLESDDPLGLVYFAVGSRLPVAHLKTTHLSLQVYREASTATNITEVPRAEAVGPTLIWPAVAGMDFLKEEGQLTFDLGQRSIGLNITLTPDQASSNPPPKRFHVELYGASGGARVHPEYGLANVTLVSGTEAQAVWVLLDQLQQPLDTTILDRVLQALLSKFTAQLTLEQLTAVLDAERTPIADSSRGLTYDLLCAMANPSRVDTGGLSQLAEVAERFAFSLLTHSQCGAQAQRTILDTCAYISISSYHWYPTQINGHMFTGKNSDTFQLPENLLEVPALPTGTVSPSACRRVQLTEYSTEHWFLTDKTTLHPTLLQGRGSRPLTEGNEVVYRIHTPGLRVKPGQSLCLLWSQAVESWLSDGQFCRVVEDSGNYVECACSHLSVYTAHAQMASLASYNEAFYASGFICISAFVLAIISHLLCSRFPMFAAKLLTHMMVGCLGTQICFLVSAFRGRVYSEDSCAVLGLFSHYFLLSQFCWMLLQAVNFWQVLVMNDEQTERRYLVYFLLGWGLPALVIIILVIVLLGGFGWTIHRVYGLVHGDVCFIPNIYAALCTAALVPLICLVGVLVVFIHAYQVTQQWKAYDDVYRGRTNSSEVPMVLYLFALVSLVLLWAGLHMGYRYLWMLILYVIFNLLLGLYVFAVYFLMHNQLCWPAKASYTVEMNGQGSPDSAYQGGGAATIGGEINKSTQNLIRTMEEVSADWERASLRLDSQPSSVFKQSPQGGAYATDGGFINTNLVADDESQDFDDLIFALKTGSGLNLSDNESIHGSHDGGSTAPSQIVELRRIPIADTHL
uniref:Adhesion G-protein coupled receptor V1 n=1 Tax=Oncorhynchus mykiss TaxID=8022 RepID=A0A8K9V586_ONCMY